MNFKHKRLTAVLLGLVVATLVAMAGCQQDKPACTAHTDANNDSLCDVCGVKLTPAESTPAPPASVLVNVRLHNDYGKPVVGAQLTITPNVGEESYEIVTDANGAGSVTLTEGEYYITFTQLPQMHLIADRALTVVKGMDVVTLEAIDNTPNGTLEKPFILSSTHNPASFTANAELYFKMRAGEGRNVTIECPHLEVVYNDVTYKPDENGVISFRVTHRDPKADGQLKIINTSSEELVAEIIAMADPGTTDNPFYIENLGESITALVPKEGVVHYRYEVTESGTITVTSLDTNNNICMQKVSANPSTGTVSSAYTFGEPSVSIEAQAGDYIIIMVAVVNPVNPDGDSVDFTVDFTEA